MHNPVEPLGKVLIAAGVVLVVLGIALSWGKFLRLGSLPGDFTWSGRGWQVSIPLATSIILSLLLTVALNLLARRR